MHILLIDDDEWQLELFERELTQSGHTVVKSANVYGAIAKLDESLPDAIVLDLMLPGANGITLLHEMRSYDDLAALPVVVVTASRIDSKALELYGVKRVFDKAKISPGDITAAISEAVR